MADARTGCPPDLLAAAVAVTGDAAGLALPGFRRPDLGVERKGDGTPVTSYDRAVERALRSAIAERWPDDAVVGEEGVDVVGTSGRRWVLDPIDGTGPFARGVVTWGTLVALFDREGPLLGVVACPWAGELVAAGRGLGCTLDERPARASQREELAGSVLATSGLEWWPPGAVERVLGAGVKVRTWGNAYGLALAATGRVDAFFDAGVQPWDVAPAPVLMAEAGGRFSTLVGDERIDAGDALCCGEPLLGPLLGLLRG